MDLYMIVLRIIHIFAGIAWVGGSMMMTFFIVPTVAALGQDGAKVMRHLLLQTKFAAYFPAAGGLTLLSGLLLYYDVSYKFDSDWTSSSFGTVLTIGSVAGIIAFAHGMMLGRKTMRMKALILEMGGNPPTPEQGAEIQGIQAFMGKHSPIVLAETLIAVFGMASARSF